MNLNQGNFNFDAQGDESGYQHWQEELDAFKKQLESRHGIILGSKVRLTLRGEDAPLEGIITLSNSKQPRNRTHLHLNIGSRTITTAEIESITRL